MFGRSALDISRTNIEPYKQLTKIETSAAKTIQAYKDQAAKAGLVLRAPEGIDSGDFPDNVYTRLQRIRRINSIGKEHKKIVKTVSRALVTLRDEKTGKPTRKEYLYYTGEFETTDHRGVPYSAGFEIGKYKKPKIVHNSNLTYDSKTGLPLGNEKILSGQETVWEIEVPRSKEARKKLIDSIIGDDNHPDNVLYYIRHLNESNYEQSRDPSFSYEEFVNLSIEELTDTSQKGAGFKIKSILYR